MVNTDICAERRWKYEFNEAGGTWPCSVGLRASVPAAGPLGAGLGGPTTDLFCDLSDLHPLQASERSATSLQASLELWACHSLPQSLHTATTQGRWALRLCSHHPLPPECPSWVSPPIHTLWSRTSMSPPPEALHDFGPQPLRPALGQAVLQGEPCCPTPGRG